MWALELRNELTALWNQRCLDCLVMQVAVQRVCYACSNKGSNALDLAADAGRAFSLNPSTTLQKRGNLFGTSESSGAPSDPDTKINIFGGATEAALLPAALAIVLSRRPMKRTAQPKARTVWHAYPVCPFVNETVSPAINCTEGLFLASSGEPEPMPSGDAAPRPAAKTEGGRAFSLNPSTTLRERALITKPWLATARRSSEHSFSSDRFIASTWRWNPQSGFFLQGQVTLAVRL
ncbi:hypothetical protein AK812_SmicGene44690 [Symbiodinium microadriaticum]|uniref:Uncharacterized protein n=1 Tax=Symbiodinium microadriaticum TaxID=2951 RepID=A0A1Q9BXT4_SYMMI|nr:hypothetical protein AK812_SmicGene44690 [Symbiodinium microadriaticum]